ncbi:MAG TPA: hypothetical protein VHE30_22070 [Polyangiaceae bacterium]|nr:hypothetical protein [Polyangiaceae bacterium]
MDARHERARRIQRRLESFYELEAGPDVTEYVRDAEAGERETLFVRENEGALELALLLPVNDASARLDHHAQLVEGVSHFVYVAERARVELPATELELELQAEVDKFVVLAFEGTRLDAARARQASRALYGNVRHLHAEETERGHRYRLAATLAARVAGRLRTRSPGAQALAFLRRFYRVGQAEKIRLATAW